MTQFHPFDCICVDIWGSGVRRDDFLADVFRTVFVCVMEMELGMELGLKDIRTELHISYLATIVIVIMIVMRTPIIESIIVILG